jgi:hypothetical protein
MSKFKEIIMLDVKCIGTMSIDPLFYNLMKPYFFSFCQKKLKIKMLSKVSHFVVTCSKSKQTCQRSLFIAEISLKKSIYFSLPKWISENKK